MATIAVVPGPAAKDVEAGSQARTVNVGTRKSKLAMIQTHAVVHALAAAHPDCVFEIKARDTAAGDIDKVTPFRDMPVKNLWTHELETLMIEGKLDILVHCLKDVPTQIPQDCEIGCVLEREDPRDAFVLKAGRPPCKLSDLPAGAVIGTSSIRRSAQIALKYPHLRVADLRGNVPTRLSKLDAEDGQFDGIILAAAGLIRLDLRYRITQYLSAQDGGMMYSVGQGALALENRSGDHQSKAMMQTIDHMPTHLACLCERSMLRTLEGGCSAPLGVETNWRTGADGVEVLHLKAIVVSTDGKDFVEVDMTQPIKDPNDADKFGLEAAAELIRRGADRILAAIKAKRPTEITDLEDK